MATDGKDRYWTGHFERWERSGLSQRVYCQLNRISLSTFTLWRRRLATRPCLEIVPVSVPPVRPILFAPPALTLVVADGRYRLEVSGGVDPEALRVVLDAVEARV